MTYADPDMTAGERPARGLGSGVWAIERAFERSKTANRPIDDTQLRIVFILAIFAAAFLFLATGATRAALFSEAARGGRSGPVAAARGDLVDRNGLLLAMNLVHYGVYLDPAEVWDSVETRQKLKAALPKLSAVRLEKALKRDKRSLLFGGLTPQDKARIRDLGLPGISFEPEDRRVYPLGAQASHVIGFTDFGGRGLAGAEKALDADLIAAGADGGTVALSIDLRVQAALEDEVQKAGSEHRAKGAVGIVTDVRTGEVLAMASYPDFHPGDPGAASPDQLLNRPVQSVYEMGSTFKGITIAAGLDSGAITRESTFDATQPFRMAGRTIRDFHATNRVLTTDLVFTKSSNIGTSRIAMAVGPDKFSGYLRDLGLFDKAAVELKESARPILPAKWNEGTLASASFGHAISVSPLALAGAMNAIANGGYRIPMTIKKQEGPAPKGVRVLKPETSRAMLELMRLNVLEGSGRKADVPGLSVGGKTGTGEKVVNGRYDSRANISSFAAVFPTDGPLDAQRYFVLILVDEPLGSEATFGLRTGGWVAAAPVGHTIARIAPFLKVKPVQPIAVPENAELAAAAILAADRR